MNNNLLNEWNGSYSDFEKILKKRKYAKLNEYIDFLENKLLLCQENYNIIESEHNLKQNENNKLKEENEQLTNDNNILKNNFIENKDRIMESYKDLNMNNSIIHRNFELLVRIIASLEKSIDVVDNNIKLQNDSVNTVVTISEEFTRASQSILESIINQSNSLDEFSVIVEHMTKSINNVSNSSKDAQTLVEKVKTMAENSSAIVNQSLQSVKDIKVSSNEIEGMTKVLDDLAWQINLLSLNATIEAAQAGKAGKGFYVVANEMKRLAVASREGAGKITYIAQNIGEKIDNAMNISSNVIKTNKDMINGINETNEITMLINNAMKEQSSGTDKIIKGVNSINDMTSAIKIATEEQNTANESLLEAISKLKVSSSEVNKIIDIYNDNKNELVDVTNKIGKSYMRNIDIKQNIKK